MSALAVLEELSQSAISPFEQSVINFDPNCIAVDRLVTSLESKIEMVYAYAAITSRKCDDIDGVSKIWEAVANVCESAEGLIGRLEMQYPDCGPYQTRISDFRERALELQELHS